MDFYTNVRQYGKNILLRGVENGKRISRRIEYRPTFFVPSKNESKYKTLYGENVEPIQPGDINESREFLERYRDVETFPIYGNNRYDYTYISDEYPEDILWDKEHIRIAYIDIEVRSDNGFPEPEIAAEEVTAITVMIGDKYTVFGKGDYTPHMPNVEYHQCANEIQLLRTFLGFWGSDYPDIISGWNCKFFDIPYLINRMNRVLGEKETNNISPWKKVKARETWIMNRKQQSYDIFGITMLDYSDLYRKYSPVAAQESYRLDHIAFVELGERKLDYSDHQSLWELYNKDHQKYIEYNIRDVELVHRIETFGIKSSKLIELALTLAYDNKVNYDDVFMQVRMWDTIIFNHLRKKNIVIPQQRNGTKDTAYEGAYVKAPIPGAYNWVVSFDLNSLYPHLIMQYNMSPETLVEPDNYDDKMLAVVGDVDVDALLNMKINLSFLKKYDITITPNKQFFTTDKRGFLADIMDSMYKDRSRYKKMAIEAKKKLETVLDDPNQVNFVKREIARYNNLQLAKKVSLNSAYGAIGNQYFRFFDTRIAEGITMAGQLSYKWIEKRINEYLNNLLKTDNFDYVIAGDTDSMYLNLEPLVNKVFGTENSAPKIPKGKIIDFLDKVSEEKLQPFIDESYQNLADYINAYEQKMQMKRECLVDRAIWTAKKRYILNIWDNEGVRYKEPHVKIVGLEAIKSSTPQACRDMIKKGIDVMISGDESSMIDYIDRCREDFRKLPPEDIAFPRGVNNLNKYSDDDNLYKNKTPIHVKGSLLYNFLLKNKKLTKMYEKIKGGEKIKFCYLKAPNPHQINVIAFLNKLPVEFELEEYIDYDLQFDKSFLEPMKTILKCIDWEVERVSTLSSFWK